MPQKLTNMKINSVHLVDAGDNPHAKIAFWKNRPAEAGDVNPVDPEIEALAKATAEEIEGSKLSTVQAAITALQEIARLMHPDAPTPEAALFEYSKSAQGQETIAAVRSMPGYGEPEKPVEKSDARHGERAPQSKAAGELMEKAREISENEGVRDLDTALGIAAYRNPYLVGDHLDQTKAEVWSPARRRASS